MSTQTDARIASLANESQQQGHPITLADVDDQLRSLQHHQLPSVSSQQYYGQQYYPYIPENQLDADTRADGSSGSQKRARTSSSPDMVKKCSRCRVKRLNEDPEMLVRYQTSQGVSQYANRPVSAQLQKLHRQRAVPAVPSRRADRGDCQGDVGAGGKPLHCAATDADGVQVCNPRPSQAEPGRPEPEQEQENHVDVHLLAGQVPAAEESERKQATGGEQAENGGVRLQDHAQLRPCDGRGAAELQPQASCAAELEEGRVRGAAVPAGRRAGQTEVPRVAAQGERRERAEQAAEAGAAGHERDRRAGDARRTDRREQPAGPGTAVRHCAAAAAPAAAIPPVPGRRERGRDAAVN
ncbi:hypothetical protein KL938_003869 [Ogataea parapolymorpha]|nr:hypothetical protein KL938_003869 [Ogataea parapolymorpha]